MLRYYVTCLVCRQRKTSRTRLRLGIETVKSVVGTAAPCACVIQADVRADVSMPLAAVVLHVLHLTVMLALSPFILETAVNAGDCLNGCTFNPRESPDVGVTERSGAPGQRERLLWNPETGRRRRQPRRAPSFYPRRPPGHAWRAVRLARGGEWRATAVRSGRRNGPLRDCRRRFLRVPPARRGRLRAQAHPARLG